jgi:UDP-glucose 4-epimerase
MRALITGGAGFIGSHLLDRLLADGAEVTVIDNLSSGDKDRVPGTVPLHVTDVRDTAAVRAIVTRTRPDVIYHLAAQISVRESVADPEFDAATNVMGTLGVLNAAQEAGARVMLASTGGAMYGDGVVMPTPEAVLPGTHAPYAISKYCAEQYLQLFNRLHGTRHVALRLGNAYGPRQDPHGEAGVVAIFCGQVSRDQVPTIFGDGAQTRDYVYVSDIVAAFTSAAAYTGTQALFNIGTGKGTSVLELLGAVNGAAGKSLAPRHAPERSGEWKHGALDSSLAAVELGWHATIDFRDGIRRTYAHLTAG